MITPTLWYPSYTVSLPTAVFQHPQTSLLFLHTHLLLPNQSHLKTRMFSKHSKFIKPQKNIAGAHNLQKKLRS